MDANDDARRGSRQQTAEDDDMVVIVDDEHLSILAAIGVGAEAAAAFRADADLSGALVKLLTTRQRAHLATSGLWLPTCDPRHYDAILGLIRLTPAQQKHGFIGPVAGIACPAATCTADRIVLVDNPWLGLRLHQLGVDGVAIAEDPSVLPPLAAWLAERQVVTITMSKRGRLLLPPGIVPVATGRLVGGLDQAPASMLALLGLTTAQVRAPAPPPAPLTQRLVADLYRFATQALARGDGQDLLAACGLDRPELMAAYRPGVITRAAWRNLSAEDRRTLGGHHLSAAVVLPACDDQGAVVDLVAVQPTGRTTWSLWSAPRGRLAPTLPTAAERLTITDSVQRLSRCWDATAPPLLLRSVDEAQADAVRWAAGGLRSVVICAHRGGAVIAAACRAAGVAVESVSAVLPPDPFALAAPASPAPPVARDRPAAVAPPATPSAPEPAPDQPAAAASPAHGGASSAVAVPPQDPPAVRLVEHDPARERAVFAVGPLTLRVCLPVGQSLVCAVRAERDQAAHQDHSLDLAAQAQRLRFAQVACHRLRVPSADIATALAEIAHLVRGLLRPAIGAGPAVAAPPAPAVDPAVVADAEALLTDPDLLGRASADLTALGWDADVGLHAVAMLALASRLGDAPLWLGLTTLAVGGGAPALQACAACLPPQQVLRVGLLSHTALLHTQDLRHRVLLLDDAAVVPPAAVTVLGLLHTRGAIAAAVAHRGVQGRIMTTVQEISGPIAVLAAAADGVPTALRRHLTDLALDAPDDRTPRQRPDRRWVDAADPQTTQRIARRWQTAQALLHPAHICIPDAAHLAVPSVPADLQACWWQLIAASALLHQRQRRHGVGHVIAAEADIATATRLLPLLADSQRLGLSVRAHQVLRTLRRAPPGSITQEDLARLVPGLSRPTRWRAMQELVTHGWVQQIQGRAGQQARWQVVADGVPAAALLPLAATGTDGGGDGAPTTPPTCSPVHTCSRGVNRCKPLSGKDLHATCSPVQGGRT